MTDTHAEDTLFMAAYLIGKSVRDAAQRDDAAKRLVREAWALGVTLPQRAKNTVNEGFSLATAEHEAQKG